MNNAFLNLFQQVQQDNHFDALRISIASPEKIREWSYGEVKKPETTAPLSRSVMVFSAAVFSGRSRTTSAFAVSTSA